MIREPRSSFGWGFFASNISIASVDFFEDLLNDIDYQYLTWGEKLGSAELYDFSVGMDLNRATYRLKSGNYSVDTPVLYPDTIEEYHRSFSVEPGLSVYTAKIPSDIECSNFFEIKSEVFSFNCVLSGKLIHSFKGEDGEFTREIDGSNTLFIGCSAPEKGYGLKPKGIEFITVSLFFDPSFLRMAVGDDISQVKPVFRKMFNPEIKVAQDEVVAHEPLSGKLESLAWQIVDAPNATIKESMTITMKVKELFSSIITDTILKPEGHESYSLSAGDMGRIADVQKIVDANLADPPSLAELAKMTGLNKFKLKIGFKEMFDSTIYEYARRERMNWAKSLMDSGNFSVSETAWEVGYTNVSHFIACFKKHFFISPGQYISKVR